MSQSANTLTPLTSTTHTLHNSITATAKEKLELEDGSQDPVQERLLDSTEHDAHVLRVHSNGKVGVHLTAAIVLVLEHLTDELRRLLPIRCATTRVLREGFSEIHLLDLLHEQVLLVQEQDERCLTEPR